MCVRARVCTCVCMSVCACVHVCVLLLTAELIVGQLTWFYRISTTVKLYLSLSLFPHLLYHGFCIWIYIPSTSEAVLRVNGGNAMPHHRNFSIVRATG